MEIHFSEELDAEQSVERHEEEEEDGDVVNLLTGSFEDLVDSGFGHREFEEHSDEADHDQWTRGPQNGQWRVSVSHVGHLQDLKNIKSLLRSNYKH